MDHLAALHLFTRIVELGSFSRAAEQLDIPRATATHAIKQLEAQLSTRLLERSTRHVRPTPDGEAFHERCVHILSELDDAEASLRHAASNPRGTLRVDMHGTHATEIVLPRIREFRARYPNVDIVISSEDRLVDLVREGIDVAIRGGQIRDSSLIAKPLAVIPEVTCASPAYLERFGTPRHPSELDSHQAVQFFNASGGVSYPFEFDIDGKIREIHMQGWLSVNNAESYVVAARNGCGLIQLPRFHIEHDLRDGRLVEVLADYAGPGFPITALYPHRRQLSPRVRIFLDWVGQLYAEVFAAR
ncbi:MAG TPA: LysR family transcriptional regulator [Oleiagrimonas sp.]|nr:LysR family transcriptional regulator [Oleiagrimonas sp.]